MKPFNCHRTSTHTRSRKGPSSSYALSLSLLFICFFVSKCLHACPSFLSVPLSITCKEGRKWIWSLEGPHARTHARIGFLFTFWFISACNRFEQPVAHQIKHLHDGKRKPRKFTKHAHTHTNSGHEHTQEDCFVLCTFHFHACNAFERTHSLTHSRTDSHAHSINDFSLVQMARVGCMHVPLSS